MLRFGRRTWGVILRLQVFLWNFWWMRTALASKIDFFHTAFLFAPAGTDLTLHTHTALPAFAGATVLGSMPLIMALNITTLASLALNGICAYALAWSVTHDRAGALVAGIIFGCSPFIAISGGFSWSIGSTAEAAADRLRADDIRFIVVNRTTASSTLQQYVERQLAVTKIAERDDRVLHGTR